MDGMWFLTFLLYAFLIGVPIRFVVVTLGAIIMGWEIGTRGVPVNVKRDEGDQK